MAFDETVASVEVSSSHSSPCDIQTTLGWPPQQRGWNITSYFAFDACDRTVLPAGTFHDNTSKLILIILSYTV